MGSFSWLKLGSTQLRDMATLSLALLIISMGMVSARSRTLLEATTNVEIEEMTEITTEYIEEFLGDNEDGNDGLENTDVNCHKCLKSSFKFRKELFCKKCLKKGLYDGAKVPQDHCKKCKKEKYFNKHQAYCEVKCRDYTPQEKEDETEEMTTSETPTSTSTKSPDLGPLGNLFKLIIQANTWQ